MDLKDDTTEMSTVVKTDSIAFAKSKLGRRRFDSKLRQGACSVLPPTLVLPLALSGEWAFEFTSKGRHHYHGGLFPHCLDLSGSTSEN